MDNNHNISSLHFLAMKKLNKKEDKGAKKIAEQARALTALMKALSSNPSKHMVAHNLP